MLKNQKGSVMTIAFVMIAVISFSLTSITAYTFRTASNTNRIVDSNTDMNEAKRIIDESMTLFKEDFSATMEANATDPENPYDWFESLPDYDEDYAKESGIIDDIESKFPGVSITLADDKYTPREELGVTSDFGTARAYRFAFEISESREIVQYLFLSNYGVEYDEFEAFIYSIGTSKNLVLNGGQYIADDSDNYTADLYGNTYYEGFSTAYKKDNGEYEVVPAGEYNYPAGANATFTSPNFNTCEQGSSCLTTDSSGNLIVKKDSYATLEGLPDANYYSDLFMSFDFDEFLNDTLNETLIENNALDTSTYDSIDVFTKPEDPDYNPDNDADTVLSNLVASGDLTEYTSAELNGNPNITSDSVVMGDVTLNSGGILDLNGNVLIINGTLQIDDFSQIIGGQLFVLGDMNIHNNQDLVIQNVFYTAGQVEVKFEGSDDNGITTQIRNNDPVGAALYSKGHILFEKNHTADGGSWKSRSAIMLMSDSSIKFDSAVEWMGFGGAIYAQGNGEGLDDVFIEDQSGEKTPFRGIIINSHNGEIDPDTGDVEAGYYESADRIIGGNKIPWAGSKPNKKDAADTFSFNDIRLTSQNSNKIEQLKETFGVIPDFERLLIVPNVGELVEHRSTFIYETIETGE